MTIQTGIDGFRVIAARTNELDGQEGPFWCGPDGVWKDVWLATTPPAAAKVLIYRRGCSKPFVGIARWALYRQTYPDGQLSGLWVAMPDNRPPVRRGPARGPGGVGWAGNEAEGGGD